MTLTTDGLFGGRVRDHDAAGADALFFHALDDHAVVQGTDFHGDWPYLMV
jgi:hypothetical protein